MSRRFIQGCIAWALMLACSLAVSVANAAIVCPGNCDLTPASVKNAAGVDPNLLRALSFRAGEEVTSASAEAIGQIVKAWNASPRHTVLHLQTSADPGMKGRAATALARARAASLKKSLIEAGIPAAKVQVSTP